MQAKQYHVVELTVESLDQVENTDHIHISDATYSKNEAWKQVAEKRAAGERVAVGYHTNEEFVVVLDPKDMRRLGFKVKPWPKAKARAGVKQSAKSSKAVAQPAGKTPAQLYTEMQTQVAEFKKQRNIL